MTAQMLRGSDHFIRWDEFSKYLKPIELTSASFISNDALKTDIEAFTNICRDVSNTQEATGGSRL
jgi:hypothetical protein